MGAIESPPKLISRDLTSEELAIHFHDGKPEFALPNRSVGANPGEFSRLAIDPADLKTLGFRVVGPVGAPTTAVASLIHGTEHVLVVEDVHRAQLEGNPGKLLQALPNTQPYGFWRR